MKSATTNILAGMHAMLVEDQSLIALDTEMLLRELGAKAVDSFVSAESALEWLASASPDVGVLDINLGGETSYPVADVLRRRSKPFIFTTGYGEGIIVPERHAQILVVGKPYTRDTLARAFLAALGERQTGQ